MRVILDTENMDPSALEAARAFVRKHAPGFVCLSNSTRGTVHAAVWAGEQRYMVYRGREAKFEVQDGDEVERGYYPHSNDDGMIRVYRRGQRYHAVCGSTSGGPSDLTERVVACAHCLNWLNGYKHALGLADD